MTLITNPFTGQILNANPEGHNQYWNPNGLATPRSAAESRALIIREAGVPVKLSKLHRHLYGTTDYESDERGIGRPVGIKIKKHPLSRASLLHELGHVKTKPEGTYEGSSADDEGEAWKWALKHRKRFGVSGKSVKKMMRVSEVDPKTGSKVLDLRTYFKNRPKIVQEYNRLMKEAIAQGHENNAYLREDAWQGAKENLGMQTENFF